MRNGKPKIILWDEIGRSQNNSLLFLQYKDLVEDQLNMEETKTVDKVADPIPVLDLVCGK